MEDHNEGLQYSIILKKDKKQLQKIIYEIKASVTKLLIREQ